MKMMFMNEYEIDNALARYRDHPLLGPATMTLSALRDAANARSDGWAYWPKPCRAAKKLQELITGDPTRSYRDDERDDVTEAKLRAAYAPIKAFRTRQGFDFTITEPGSSTPIPEPRSNADVIIALTEAEQSLLLANALNDNPAWSTIASKVNAARAVNAR